MKTDKLFGVRFVTDPQWKTRLLDHFIAGKIQKLNDQFKQEQARLKAIERYFKVPIEKLVEEQQQREKSLDFTEITNFLRKETDCQHYYITVPVLEMSQKIRVKEPFDLEWMEPVRDGKRQLNFGSQFIRYEKKGSRIIAISAKLSPDSQGRDYLNYSVFNMDLASKEISKSQILDDYDPSPKNSIPFQDFDLQSRKLFFQLVTFMELSKIQEILLPPGRKNGVKKSVDHMLNNSSFPITIVNTNWNKIIRREGFDVNGHIRKQPCGPGNRYRELIWIDAYHKTGYNLRAGKIREQKKRGPRL